MSNNQQNTEQSILPSFIFLSSITFSSAYITYTIITEYFRWKTFKTEKIFNQKQIEIESKTALKMLENESKKLDNESKKLDNEKRESIIK